MAEATLFEVHLHYPANMTQALPPMADYSRNSTLNGVGKTAVAASSPQGFGGDDARYNPEEFMLMSLSQCHMLTFLAVAAKKQISVLSYTDHATGNLYKAENGKMQMERATLHPCVTVAAGTDTSQLKALHDKAHANCFMSNSVNFPTDIVDTFAVA